MRVFDVFAAKKPYHAYAVLWQVLLEAHATGQAPLLRPLADAVGLEPATVRKMVRVLERLGLVVPLRSGLEIQTDLSAATTAALADLRTGRLIIDARSSALQHVDGHLVDIGSTLPCGSTLPLSDPKSGSTLPIVPEVQDSDKFATSTKEGPTLFKECNELRTLQSPADSAHSLKGGVGENFLLTPDPVVLPKKKRKRAPRAKGTTPSKTPANPAERDAMEALFRHWQDRTGFTTHSLTDDRKKVILRALRWGYTVDQLASIINWAVVTDYMNGTKPGSVGVYLDFGSLINSQEKIGRYLISADRFQQGVQTTGQQLLASDKPAQVRIF